MRIVLYKYYNFLYYILIFFKFFGLRFNYLNISNFSILGSNLSLDNLANRLKKRGITPLPIEDIEKIIDIQPFMHDLKKEVFATNCKVINDNLIDKSFRKLKTCERRLIELVPITLPAGKSIKLFPELLINAS